MFYAGCFDCGPGLVDARFDLDDAVSFIQDFVVWYFFFGELVWARIMGTMLGWYCCE